MNRSLDQLFEDAEDAVFIADPGEDRFLDANAAACRLLGYTREEFLATPISQIHPKELTCESPVCGSRLGRDGLRRGIRWR